MFGYGANKLDSQKLLNSVNFVKQTDKNDECCPVSKSLDYYLMHTLTFEYLHHTGYAFLNFHWPIYFFTLN